MKKKGFTLIELIAVITLLALIVLVTVPVIINTLSKSEQKEYEDFKKLITGAADLYVERNRDLYPELDEIGGALDITADILVNEGYLQNSLKNPINNNPASNYKITVLVNPDGIFEYEIYERNKLVDLATVSKDKGIEKIDRCSENGKCEPGTAFAIKVNDTDVYKFYVIADDGEKVTLIMDRNLGSTVAWVDKDDYADNDNYGASGNNNKGPITVLNYLNNQTREWTNIPAITSYTYNNNLNGTIHQYGYQKLVITNGQGVLTSQDGTTTNLTGTMRARLLTEEEANTIRTNNNGTIPTWLYGNLNSLNRPGGYWLLTALPSNPNTYPRDSFDGRYMGYSGHISSLYVCIDAFFGIRPVIEISRY